MNWICVCLAKPQSTGCLFIDIFDRYLPSLPYQDNPVLHVYAGFISLFLAQPLVERPHSRDSIDSM